MCINVLLYTLQCGGIWTPHVLHFPERLNHSRWAIHMFEVLPDTSSNISQHFPLELLNDHSLFQHFVRTTPMKEIRLSSVTHFSFTTGRVKDLRKWINVLGRQCSVQECGRMWHGVTQTYGFHDPFYERKAQLEFVEETGTYFNRSHVRGAQDWRMRGSTAVLKVWDSGFVIMCNKRSNPWYVTQQIRHNLLSNRM